MARRIKPVREIISDIPVVKHCGAGVIAAVIQPTLSEKRQKAVVKKSLPAAVKKFREIPKAKVLVLDRLREEQGFDPLEAITKHYKDMNSIFENCKKKFEDDHATRDELAMLKFAATEKRECAVEIQRYCYPYMKNADSHGPGKQVTFNINTGTANPNEGLKIAGSNNVNEDASDETINVSVG